MTVPYVHACLKLYLRGLQINVLMRDLHPEFVEPKPSATLSPAIISNILFTDIVELHTLYMLQSLNRVYAMST
ncbi:4577_t:CDS:2 [Paraglomus occultum]|uniref:4577_t:CDS:1 n=1 Tax=Paraglomus occultum TaxID=144539 RepID=A0A9N9C430_9GLOM|nr:4577_t:CDS:2 [Paraglomus occultum]